MRRNSLHQFLQSERQPTFFGTVRHARALQAAVMLIVTLAFVVPTALSTSASQAAPGSPGESIVICTTNGFAQVETDATSGHGWHCSCVLGCVSSCCAPVASASGKLSPYNIPAYGYSRTPKPALAQYVPDEHVSDTRSIRGPPIL